MRVVLDANVAAAGIIFRGEAWACLVKLARRQAFAFGTDFTLAETRETVTEMSRLKQARHNVGGALAWYSRRSAWSSPCRWESNAAVIPTMIPTWRPHSQPTL